MDNRIHELVKALGISQGAFARRIGVDVSYITLLIQGKRNPSERLVESICREFNVRREWMENGTGEMFGAAGKPLLERRTGEARPLTESEKPLAPAAEILAKLAQMDNKQLSYMMGVANTLLLMGFMSEKTA